MREQTSSVPARLWRLVRRLTGRASATRLVVIERELRRAARADRVQSAALRALQAELAHMTERFGQQATKGVSELRHLEEAVRKFATHAALHEDPLFARGRMHLRKELGKLGAGTTTLIVGPWTGEVGFELLYWIPFVRWACTEFGLDAHRLVVVSRGGVASWYGLSPRQYVDVFSIIDQQEFHDATAEQVSLKQRELRTLERRIIDEVARRHGLGETEVLHPSMMFKAFRQFWEGDAGFARIEEFTKYALIHPPTTELPSDLPDDYVAVRFYFRRSFPDTPQNRAFAAAVVAGLAERRPVVLLTSGVKVDDHRDWEVPAHKGVTVFGGCAAERNLEVQSAIIGGARAFVGTYGGFSYLAPLYGVPAVAFHSRLAFERNHLDVAQRAFEQVGAAPLTTVNVSQADLVRAALHLATGSL